VGTMKGKRHHLEGKVAKMEIILNLCVDKKVAHKDHARRAYHAHGRALWGTNHKGGHRKKIYWLEMKKDVEHFVRTCVKCQNTKFIYAKKYKLYKFLPIPNEP